VNPGVSLVAFLCLMYLVLLSFISVMYVPQSRHMTVIANDCNDELHSL
jgi:hypothetical protein